MAKHIIFGAPGTGKTFKLIKIIEEHINKGINPNKICFCTFTKAGAEEAKDRAISRFGFSKEELKNFGTIHAICYRRFLFGTKNITSTQRKEFFNKLGIDYEITNDDEDLLTNEQEYTSAGNFLLSFYDKLRINSCKNVDDLNSLEELKTEFYNLKLANDIGDFNALFINTFDPYAVLKKYEEYKKNNNMIDYIDMLLVAYKNKYVIDAEILIVDEFQDLSPLQYEIYKLWAQDKKEVYLAGDDDQTIYSFICASPGYLIKERRELDKSKGDEETVLPVSFRIPSVIHKYTQAYIKKNIIAKNRVDKEVSSNKDGGELIEEFIDYDLERTLKYIRPDKWTYILFRTNYYKKIFIEQVLVKNGLPYHEIRGKSIWNDKTISLFNAVIKLVEKKPITPIEVKYLLSSILYKYGFFKKGLKASYKNLKKENEYYLSDLIKLGFTLKFFNICNDYESLFAVMDLKPNIRSSFNETKKLLIYPPIKLKIGTIHSSKGKEADDVIVFKDISNRVSNEAKKDSESWENEIRVFHVAQTRAKEKLIILRGGFSRADTELIP